MMAEELSIVSPEFPTDLLFTAIPIGIALVIVFHLHKHSRFFSLFILLISAYFILLGSLIIIQDFAGNGKIFSEAIYWHLAAALLKLSIASFFWLLANLIVATIYILKTSLRGNIKSKESITYIIVFLFYCYLAVIYFKLGIEAT
jgi:hypothetical protein